MKTGFFTLAALALALVACNNDNENLNGDQMCIRDRYSTLQGN